MGFYNISILKKFLFSLLVVAFIVIALLLMQKSVYATTPELPDAVKNACINKFETSNYDGFFIIWGEGSSWGLILFNYPENYPGNFYVTPTVSGAYSLIWFGFTGTTNLYTDLYGVDNNGNLNFISSDIRFGEGSGRYRIYDVVYGNYNVYWKPFRGSVDLNTVYMQDNYSPASLPDLVFENYDDSETYNNSLETGEFTYFYFKVKKNPNWDDVPFPCGFYFHNTTDYTPTNYYDVNYVSSVMLNLNEYTGSESAPNYLYAYSHDNYYYYYALPCTLPLGSYDNNSSYQLDLFYLDTETEERYTQHYNWTTNFTTAGIAKQEENRQNFRDSVVARYNNMINDLSSNGSIIGDLPDSMYNSVPFNNIIDNIYNLIHDAFTDFDYKEITFNLPHTNQSIVIPSNVMTSRVPTVFLSFLRAFYWYYICKFILYSAYSMFEMVVSGDLINNKSFDVPNVKTKMLG